jgi:hypothetical protein
MAMAPPAIETSNQDEAAAWNELRPILHAEVERLPERYRIPVILSYLEGKTNEEVAALLRWPVGTVKGRLSRARDLLRSRLVRRGMTLSAAFLMTALSHGTVFAEVVPADLVRRTIRLAGKFGPRTWPLDPPDHEPLVSTDDRLSLSSGPDVRRTILRFTPRKMAIVLLAVLCFSVATGIGINLLASGGFSPVGRPSFFSTGSTTPVDRGPGGACH